MKYIVSFLALLLLAPVMAQDGSNLTPTQKFILPASETKHRAITEVVLKPGLYYNASKKAPFFVINEPGVPSCFIPLIRNVTLHYQGERGVPGMVPDDVFEIQQKCYLKLYIYDLYHVNDLGKLAIRRVEKRKVKVIDLNSKWQRVTFGRGQFRVLGNIHHYLVKSDKRRAEECAGDTGPLLRRDTYMLVRPKTLNITKQLTCWVKEGVENQKLRLVKS